MLLKERKLNIGAVEINYAEGPESGPPLVLLHGFPGRWQEFLPILPAFMIQHHIFALDLRGQGKSGRTPYQYRSKDYIADTVRFIQQQFEEPVIIFGMSASGFMALGAAAQIPDMVKAVILGDSPIDIEELAGWMTSEGFKHLFSAFKEISKLEELSVTEISDKISNIPVQVPGKDEEIRYGDSPGSNPINIQQLAIVLKYMDPGVLEYHASGRVNELLDGFDLDRVLKKIKCRVLLVQANPSKGGMMSNKAIDHFCSIVPGAESSMIESVGHNLGLDTWEVAPLLRVVMNFMDSL